MRQGRLILLRQPQTALALYDASRIIFSVKTELLASNHLPANDVTDPDGRQAANSAPELQLIRVAQYVRMSTDHQRYSTENQAAAIQQYADLHGMVIVRTYADDGKSGLSIDGRHALKQLIQDIRNGQSNYEAVLVYDVSRWGRFQDTDESAHYEYICTSAGIRIVFCAESFDNDGTPIAAIVKSVKRAMAGEYSRELSVKVFAGQCRLVALGYHQGGAAGFGLRRKLVNDRGETKAELRYGEHKSLQTDRVVLAPGPQSEIATVARIYHLFVYNGKNERDIAIILNGEKIRTDMNRPWTPGTVHQVLTNEKYIGNNVYNRVSFKLKKQRIRNARDKWVRCDSAFAGIVNPILFARAREIILKRSERLDDTEMLRLLRDLLTEKGALSGLIIDEHPDMPSSSAYRSRFGSLLRVYSLVGYRPSRDYRYLAINERLRRQHPELIAEISHGFESAGAWVVANDAACLLVINGEFTVSVVIGRCKQMPSGSHRWNFRFDSSRAPDITVAVRMDHSNTHALDYYLFPHIDELSPAVRLCDENPLSLDAYRCDSLDKLYVLGVRRPLPEAA